MSHKKIIDVKESVGATYGQLFEDDDELNTYIPPNIRLITRSLSGSHTIEDSQPMSCLPG